MSPSDLKLLQKIQGLALAIETQAKDQNFSEAQLAELNALLYQFEFCEDENLNRLAMIPDHLHPKMSLQHFLNFMLPIERLIDRNLSDDDFTISSADSPTKEVTRRPLYFVLDNLRSAFNVGSIFRLADGVGVSQIYICGYTPDRTNTTLIKTSMGAVDFVTSEHFDKIKDAIADLRQKGVFTIALETGKAALSLHQSPIQGPTAFIVGNERFGLDRQILQMVDEVRSIDMYGVKNSLNVANALTAAAFEWSRQNP